MTIYLYSEDKEIIQILAQELQKDNHSCILFNDQISFLNSIVKQTVDLTMIDYTAWNHDIFPFIGFMREQKIFQPFLFYNDPCITLNTRAKHWEMQLRTLLNMFPMKDKEVEKNFIERYKPVFENLANLVESKELAPYIPLMAPVKQLPDELPARNSLEWLKKHYAETNSENSNTEVNLPNNLKFLFNYLISKKSIEVSFSEIIEYYQTNNKTLNEKSLKVLISKLRSSINNEKYVIITKDNSYILKEIK